MKILEVLCEKDYKENLQVPVKEMILVSEILGNVFQKKMNSVLD